MSNLLADPANWQDYAGTTPPLYWTGDGYGWLAGGGGDYFRLTLLPTPAPGDTLKATVNGSGFSTAAFLNAVVSGSVVGSIPIDASTHALEVDAQAGMQLVMTSSAGSPNPTTLYDGNLSLILPAPDFSSRPYVVGNYLRAYNGVDTPLQVWVRGEEGPLNLEDDDITVELRWPWLSWTSIPATGDTEGLVSFVITRELLWRTWGNDYGINLARWRGYPSLLRVVSAQRGIIALAYMEVV